MGRSMSRLVVVGGLFLALLSVSCAGDPERALNPISPSAAVVARPAGALPQANLEGADLQNAAIDDRADVGHAAAAALNLSGNWTGTITARDGSPPFKLTFKFTHTGTKFKGVLQNPPFPGFTATFDLTQKSATASTRTFQGTFKLTGKGAKCPSVTMTASMVVKTSSKPMTLTGTSKGKGTDCNIGTDKFALRKG